MSYLEEASKTKNEKITLVTIESVKRFKVFDSNGLNWERVFDHFIVEVKDGTTALVSGVDYLYEPKLKKLTLIGGVNPKTRDIHITFRHFYSSAPIIAPFNLSTGESVEWDARIISIGSVGQRLDDEAVGIVLETSSNVDLINNDGHFDETFDTHIWENQPVKFYVLFGGIPASEARLLFDGVVENKTYSDVKVSFKVKDFVYKLKDQVILGLYSEADGDVIPSLIGKAKRRIYGKADNVKCVSLDANLSGYTLTGTMSLALEATSIIGVGTLFLSEIVAGDELNITIGLNEFKFSVDNVVSNTELTIGKNADVSFANQTMKNKSSRPWRFKNRTWQIAGHKLRAPITTITAIKSSTQFEVVSIEDFFVGDIVNFSNGQRSTVRRVSGNTVLLNTTVDITGLLGGTIQKSPILNAYRGNIRLFEGRDYSISNTTTASKIIFNSDAEFNSTEQLNLNKIVTFTNGSRQVTTTANIDFQSILSPRDWIRSTNSNRATWYEISKVESQIIHLVSPFSASGGPFNDTIYYKKIEGIDENTLITVSCMGMERSNVWMKTASDCVRDLVINDAGFSAVNEASFAKAKAMCPYILSMVLPDTIDGDYPTIRDVITKINESVYGSLYGDSSQNSISYSILNATKPENFTEIRDDDIIDFDIATSQKIANKITVNYAPFVDIFSGQDSLKKITRTNEFVDKTSEIKNTIEKTIYLYEDDKAEIIAQRLAFFNSMSTMVLTLKTKLNLSHLNINDKIYMNFDRIYARYSSTDRRKIGTIVGVKNNGFSMDLIISDLGNIFNRIPSIAPNTTSIYSTASDNERLLWGFILDNDTETADASSEVGLGSGVIG